MTSYEIASLVAAGLAFIVSVVALVFAIRATRANEKSAYHAGRANDLNLIQFFQSNMAKQMEEIDKAKAMGNETRVKALQFSLAFSTLEMFKRISGEVDREGRQKFAEYLRGIAIIDPNAQPEAFLSEIFGEDYESPLSE